MVFYHLTLCHTDLIHICINRPNDNQMPTMCHNMLSQLLFLKIGIMPVEVRLIASFPHGPPSLLTLSKTCTTSFIPSMVYTCYLNWQIDFADMIKLMIFKWGDYLELCRWIQCNKKSIFIKAGGQRNIWQQKQHKREIWRCYWLWRLRKRQFQQPMEARKC